MRTTESTARWAAAWGPFAWPAWGRGPRATGWRPSRRIRFTTAALTPAATSAASTTIPNSRSQDKLSVRARQPGHHHLLRGGEGGALIEADRGGVAGVGPNGGESHLPFLEELNGALQQAAGQAPATMPGDDIDLGDLALKPCPGIEKYAPAERHHLPFRAMGQDDVVARELRVEGANQAAVDLVPAQQAVAVTTLVLEEKVQEERADLLQLFSAQALYGDRRFSHGPGRPDDRESRGSHRRRNAGSG